MKIYNLLSQTDRHPKIVKGLEYGILGYIMHLAPADISGFEVCPMRTAGCTAACLHHAGFQYARKETARINRTRFFFEDREAFMSMLGDEIARARRRARKLEMICSVRLNGTSDITWERQTFQGHANLMEAFPDVCFMDYTKRYNRRDLPSNYRLTFSRAENNGEHCASALENGMNVAVVFDTTKSLPLPKTFKIANQNVPVIDGDLHDFRYGDPKGVVVGLRVKGFHGRADQSGFVVRAA